MNFIPWRNKERDDAGVESSPLKALRTEMDRLFESYIREPFEAMDWPMLYGGEKGWPSVDVSESAQAFTIHAELPGVDPKEIDVTVCGQKVIISGEKKEAEEKQGDGYHHREVRYGSFRRTIPLPDGVDSEHVEAQHSNGVLTLTMKKSPIVAAKKIEIKTQG